MPKSSPTTSIFSQSSQVSLKSMRTRAWTSTFETPLWLIWCAFAASARDPPPPLPSPLSLSPTSPPLFFLFFHSLFLSSCLPFASFFLFGGKNKQASKQASKQALHSDTMVVNSKVVVFSSCFLRGKSMVYSPSHFARRGCLVRSTVDGRRTSPLNSPEKWRLVVTEAVWVLCH